MIDAPVAFWVDTDYDREYSIDGISRYAAYLRDAAFEPWTDNDRAVEWAEFAWRRATGPVMSPGYVRCHPRVRGAQVQRSGWDGGLLASVGLACSWPDQLRAMLTPSLALGGKAAYWHDWPTGYLGGDTCYYEPGEADLAARPYLLTTLSLQFTVPSVALPEPPADASTQLGAAQQAVAVLVSELNRIVGPVLDALAGRLSPAGERDW
jgi:hypothetical protein